MRAPADLTALEASTSRLLATVDELDGAAVRAPSLLPDWTVGHVLTHLARNADGNTRMIDGAARGEVLDQYAHGRDGRAADIEAGAGRSSSEIIDDVHRSADGLAAAFARFPDDGWDRTVRAFSGEYPVHRVPLSRRREVEFHHIDLGLGYTPRDWPRDLVDRELADAVRGLPNRLDDGTRLEVFSTDTGVGWAVGAGARVFIVRGDAASLLLWLIGRDTPDDAFEAPAGLPPLGAW